MNSSPVRGLLCPCAQVSIGGSGWEKVYSRMEAREKVAAALRAELAIAMGHSMDRYVVSGAVVEAQQGELKFRS